MSTSSSQVLGVIPARWGSTRFPGKPLVDIGGLPMVVRSAHRAIDAGCLQVDAINENFLAVPYALALHGGGYADGRCRAFGFAAHSLGCRRTFPIPDADASGFFPQTIRRTQRSGLGSERVRHPLQCSRRLAFWATGAARPEIL